jgi:hypothetical protein
MVSDKIQENQGGATRRTRARQGQKQVCWCLVSSRSPRDGSTRLHQEQAAAQKESRKDDAAVKSLGGCRASMRQKKTKCCPLVQL